MVDVVRREDALLEKIFELMAERAAALEALALVQAELRLQRELFAGVSRV